MGDNDCRHCRPGAWVHRDRIESITFETPDNPVLETAARIYLAATASGDTVIEHASPGCACGVNAAGQLFVDPICRWVA